MRLIDADELIKDRVENDPVRIAAIVRRLHMTWKQFPRR